MRIAVAGGTGLVGRHVVEALRASGHEPVALSRAQGHDLERGTGLDEALAGVTAVVDVTNTPETDPEKTRAFFAAVTGNLLAAEARAGVRHHVTLSIVGVDRVEGNGHYVGKRHQEELVLDGAIPFTILRATQFHEFAEMVAGWTTQDGVATIAPLLMQPVAAVEVGKVLAEVAVGDPSGRTSDLAGPRSEDLVDMARRTLAARGSDVRVQASWQNGPFGLDMAGDVLLAPPDARIAGMTFDDWLAQL
jgi:uncharacterized protein YbjT (DUF2867 family)